MSRKSPTCTSRRTAQPLSEYATEAEAADAAAYVARRFGGEPVPYECQTCGLWHLSPISRQTPSRTSNCAGRSGQPKAAYETRDDAERRAGILSEERGISLRVYDCACGAWHLTSR
jgi:hypothetical protein